MRFGSDGGLNEQGVIIVASAQLAGGNNRQVDTVREIEVRKHDSPWDGNRLPAPRPATAALVFMKATSDKDGVSGRTITILSGYLVFIAL